MKRLRYDRGMKIVKPKAAKPVTITVRMHPDLLRRVDSARGDMKREPFVRAILAQVLSDKNFVLKLN